MKSYIVHIENKILFFYCEVEEQVQAVMIRWYGDRPYRIELCEFRSFYGYFSGFGAPANRHIILDGEIWRMGKYNSQRCIIRSGNKARYLMNDGTIHIGYPTNDSVLHPLLQEWQRKEFS